MKLKFAN